MRYLSEQCHDRFARREGPRDARIVLRLVERNVEGMVNRRGQLFGTDGVTSGILAMLVGFAEYLAASNARARHNG